MSQIDLSRGDADANEKFPQIYCDEQGAVAEMLYCTQMARVIAETAEDKDAYTGVAGAGLGEYDYTLWREQLADTLGDAALTILRQFSYQRKGFKMSNASGWGLTARLISKHFGVLGERVSEVIANFDPETATEDDRDRLADTLRETAQVLALARAAFDKEQNDVASLRTLIANDEKATEKLAERLAAGTISEATVTLFCDELEANKGRLPQEVQVEADARSYMDKLQKIIDALSAQLVQFDSQARQAMRALAAAKAQKDLQAMRIVADIGQKPLDQAAKIDAIRQSVSQFQTAGETTLERLRRLSAKAA